MNAEGKLIGINSAIVADPRIGFAIPTGIALDAIRQLVDIGVVERGSIRFTARDLSALMQTQLKAAATIRIHGTRAGHPFDVETRVATRPTPTGTQLGNNAIAAVN